MDELGGNDEAVDSMDGSISQFLQLSRHWELGQRTQLLQSIQPISDNSVIYAIWLIESNHRGNAMTNLCLNRHGIFLASLSWVSLLIHDIKSDGMTQQSWAKILVIGLVFCAFAGDALGWSGPEEILASKRERHAITREKYSGKSILDVQQEMSSPMDVAAK
ncbi:hypothetical protein TESG_00385 [Trichophyton tonsurans CBS 112818]|uniref:FAD binding domain-containing protein n=2 Tax=Trichophyton TaxID=5550 RepID=F2PU61_TRIEC|nr:hypothetical protein TESG_00385 [Trichophyton tonsurans CBS 112818]EGE05429.1 FAD binding domain-containing protein [Trichophyton equinum CBS 127.97]